MKFFTAKQNEEIEGKLEAAETENDSLRADLSAAQERINELAPLAEANAQLQSDLTGSQSKVAEFEAKVTEFEAKIVELTAAAEVTNEKVSIRAAELLATQGHPAPVSLTGDDAEASSKLKTREEFVAMTPAARLKFVKAGGKIS